MKKRTRDLFLLLAAPVVMSYVTGCAGTGLGDGIGDIDIASYMANSDLDRTYRVIEPGNADRLINESIAIEDRIDDRRKIVTRRSGWLYKTVNVRVNTIEILTPISTFHDRYVDIDDNTFGGCFVDSMVDRFSRDGHTYNGDMLKLRGCEADGNATYYMKLGVGIVAKINDVDDEYTYLESLTIR